MWTFHLQKDLKCNFILICSKRCSTDNNVQRNPYNYKIQLVQRCKLRNDEIISIIDLCRDGLFSVDYGYHILCYQSFTQSKYLRRISAVICKFQGTSSQLHGLSWQSCLGIALNVQIVDKHIFPSKNALTLPKKLGPCIRLKLESGWRQLNCFPWTSDMPFLPLFPGNTVCRGILLPL